jgi:hypothetical protein
MGPRAEKRNRLLMQIKLEGTRFAPRRFFAVEERRMASVKSYSDPSDVNIEQGQVIVEGPDGVAVTLTPDAAEETGRRMIDAASQARAHPALPGGTESDS